MSWIIGEQQKLTEQEAARKAEYKDKNVELPENGKFISVGIRVNRAPRDVTIDSKKKPGSKFVVHEYETVDGRILGCFDSLHTRIVNALSPFAEKIASDGTEFVFIEIHNGGTLQKPAWVVVVRAGV